MITRTVDYLTAEHPAAAKYGKEHIRTMFGTSGASNIVLFIVSGIAAGIFAGFPDDIIKYIALGLVAIVWINLSVLAGFLKQWLFIFFMAVYLMLPYVFLITPGTAEAAQASELQYMLSDMFRAVPLKPMYLIAGEGDPQLVSVIIFLVYTVMFFIGLRIRSRAKRSDFYCRTRLEQLK